MRRRAYRTGGLRFRTEAIVVLIFVCLPLSLEAASSLDERFTVGPDGYLENSLRGRVDLGQRLRATAGWDIYGDDAVDAASEWRLGLEGAAASWAYLGGGMTYEPPANDLKAWSVYGFLSLSTEPTGSLRGYPTTLSLDIEHKSYELRPFGRWVDLERKAVGLELAQTFAGRLTLSAGYTDYVYDRDLNTAVLRLFLSRTDLSRSRVLSVGGTLTTFPASMVHGGISWLGPWGRLAAVLSRTEPEISLLESTAYGTEIQWEFALRDRLLLHLGVALESDDESSAAYFSVGGNLFFDGP